MLLTVVLLCAACGPREEIVYVDREPHAEDVHAADPSTDGGGSLVQPGGTPHDPAPVAVADEHQAGTGAHGPAATVGGSAAQGAPTSGPGAAVRAAASPTPPARLGLGVGLGATTATPTTNDTLSVTGGADEDDDQGTVAGKIESIVGATLKVQTQTGSERVRLAERARVERDALGSPADLKPGQFVGVIHQPSGPAR